MPTATVLDRFSAALDYPPARTTVRERASSDRAGVTQVAVRPDPYDEGHDGGEVAPAPWELAVSALASCLALAHRVRAHREGIPLESVDVEVVGELSLLDLLGVDGGDHGGGDLEVLVTLTGPDAPETYAALCDRVERATPLLRLLAEAAEVRTALLLETPSPRAVPSGPVGTDASHPDPVDAVDADAGRGPRGRQIR